MRRVGVLTALGAFCAGLALALRAHPDLLTVLDYRAWLLVFPLVPITLLANSAQFWLTARLIGVTVGLPRAVLVTVLSAAANMLPLPGGSLVRIAALKSHANTYGQTTLATIFIAGCWLGVTLTLAGLALAYLEFRPAAIVCVSSGLLALGVFAGLLLSHGAAASRWLVGLVAVQTGMVVVGAIRLWLCFEAVGMSVALPQATVLTLSNVIASLIGIAPAGLGITEALAAGLAAAIGISAASGFLAAVLNRISNLIVVGPTALLLHAMDMKGRPPGSTAGNETSRE
ncbi:hypothetical protein PC39_02175 [Salinisphaera sp. PC39]